MTKIPKDMNKYSENDELGREELLNIFENWWYGIKTLGYNTKDDKEAYKQIKVLIQKSKVTEEWIGEKARKMKELDGNWIREKAKIMHNMIYPPKVCEYKCDLMTRCKDFIRKLVEEMLATSNALDRR